MEHQKILNVLNEADDSKFVTRKWNFVNDQSNANYDVETEIICNTEVLRSNFCDYNYPYILIRSDILTTSHNNPTPVGFKNCAPFTKCNTKIDGTTLDDGEDIDLVMPMYNLLDISSNYSDTTGGLWVYSEDESTNFDADIGSNNAFKSFEYKAKLLENTFADGNNSILKNATITVALKSLSNIWRSLEMPLINCEVELKLRWTKHCVFIVLFIVLFLIPKIQNHMFL